MFVSKFKSDADDRISLAQQHIAQAIHSATQFPKMFAKICNVLNIRSSVFALPPRALRSLFIFICPWQSIEIGLCDCDKKKVRLTLMGAAAVGQSYVRACRAPHASHVGYLTHNDCAQRQWDCARLDKKLTLLFCRTKERAKGFADAMCV